MLLSRIGPAVHRQAGHGMAKGRTVSLVLGSGAARGLAHIGVIEWLDEHGYKIESISGASMGALVGGIYAAGKLDVYKTWACALEKADVVRFLDLAFSSEGLFKGGRIMDTLRDMVGDCNIEDLPISYTAVATDLDRQREVWLTEGSLFDAIRASIAVPTIFTPQPYRGMKLLDGGLLNPVPIAPTFKDMTDMTIAVNLNAARADHARRERKERESSKPAAEEALRYHEKVLQFLDNLQKSITERPKSDLGLFDLLSSSFETMQNAIANMKLATFTPDVVIHIPRGACKAFEFYRAEEMVALGYRYTAQAMERSHG
jgi:NTE family protein